MLSHLMLFRHYILGKGVIAENARNERPFSPSEWAAFNRALYQKPARFSPLWTL